MNRQTTIDMYPDNCGFRVWDAKLNPEETYHEVNEQTLSQGFSARFGRSLNFSTLGDCMGISIEVWYADKTDEIALKDDTIRAILVPFLVSEWFKIGDFMGAVEVSLSAAPGNYALLFEIKLRNDEEYLNSSEYQENIEVGFSEEWCCLTFYPRAEAIQPEIVRLDAWSSPPYELLGYSMLKPTYPLLMEVGRA